MKTLKNVDVVFIKGEDGIITASICDGDEFYDLTFLEENCEYSYEKGIGEKFSFTDFDTFDEFYDFVERNHQNKMSYQECVEKYFPKQEKVKIVNRMDWDGESSISEEDRKIIEDSFKKISERAYDTFIREVLRK